MITASNGSDTVTRNSSHFKVVPKQLLQDHSGKNEVENPTSVGKEDILQRRSQRQIKPPVRFRRTLLLFLRIENVDQSEADLQRLFHVSYFRYFFQSSSQEEVECNVVNHEFITSRDLSVKVRSYSGQTSMVLFSCSLGRQYKGERFRKALVAVVVLFSCSRVVHVVRHRHIVQLKETRKHQNCEYSFSSTCHFIKYHCTHERKG